MRVILILIVSIFFTLISTGQAIVDTIITNQLDTIPCKITYINPYTVFYKIQKRKKLKDRLMPRIDIKHLAVNQNSIKVPEQKLDQGINEYFRKSKLNRSYETLLIDRNNDPSLILLADSTFTSKKLDYLYLGSKIQTFANRYKCKLIYISNIKKGSTYSVNAKLYDAPDAFYQETLDQHSSNKIYFLRSSNNTDAKELKVKIGEKKISLQKNDYYAYSPTAKDSAKIDALSDSTNFQLNSKAKPVNVYYYIGNANFYSHYKMTGSVVLGYVLGGIIGGIIIQGIATEKTRVSNFIGEFIILNIA